eukprot:761255-Hanusia_phi.AAC.2
MEAKRLKTIRGGHMKARSRVLVIEEIRSLKIRTLQVERHGCSCDCVILKQKQPVFTTIDVG